VKKLKKIDILNYSLGDLGINLNFQMIGFFLAYFYTDVFGISPAHVAGLFLVARVWDAVNDPIMGYLADHTRTRWGRFRPYVFFGALPLNLIMLACFFVPDFSPTAKVVYAYITYILHGMIFTAVGLPYSSISAVMTQDQQERAVISTYRMFFAIIIAMSIIGIGTRPFVAQFENEATGFFMIALIYSVVSTVLLWFSAVKSKERVDEPGPKYHLKDIWPIIRKNDALLVLAGALFLNTCVWVLGNAVALYYFKYIVGDVDLQSIFFRWMLPANLLGVVLTPMLTAKFGKLKTFMAGSLIAAALLIARHFVPVDLLSWFFFLSMVASTGMMFCSISQWGMVPDTVEYGHWKTGIRSEGIPFAFFSFTQKAAIALASSFAAWIMSVTGYEANTELTASAQTAICWLFNLVPAVFSIACFVALLFYKLDGAKFKQIIAELDQRKS
jgi:sugar (glycoside-pentoside-hexuronide) transporter